MSTPPPKKVVDFPSHKAQPNVTMSPTFLGGEYIDLHLILTFSVVVAVGWDQAGPGLGVILECVALWRVGGAGGRGTRLERGVEEQTETTTDTQYHFLLPPVYRGAAHCAGYSHHHPCKDIEEIIWVSILIYATNQFLHLVWRCTTPPPKGLTHCECCN